MRQSRLALLYVINICLLHLPLSAQITDVTSVQSPPIPGAGHGYVQMLDETVNPSNGALSIRINVPVPAGRHLSVPFGFGYDSNSAKFINYQGASNNLSYMSGGGWSYVVPHIDFQARVIQWYAQWLNGAGVGSTSETCNFYNDFIFTDSQGGTHALDLALFESGPGCTDAHNVLHFNGNNVLTGGDGKVTATMSAQWSFPSITVSDSSGTVYYFSGTPSRMRLAPMSSDISAVPDWIENSNGDKVTINDSGGGVFNMVDTLGRTAIASSGFGTTGNTVTVSGLTGQYTVTWGTASSTWAPLPATSSDCTLSGCGNCPIIGGGVPSSLPVISAIGLPDGTSYVFEYDPTYGLPTKIHYPTGGYVRYVWQVNSFSDAIDFYADSKGQFNCHEHFDTLAVKNRYVSHDGNTAHEYEEQDFSVSQTTWSTIPGSGLAGYTVWNAGDKATTVVTKDTLLGTSTQTSYSYAPIDLGESPYDGSWSFTFNGNCQTSCNTDGILWSPAVYSEFPVEQVTSFKDGSGNVLKTVTQSFIDQYRMNCAVTDLAPSSISGTFYSWGAGDQLTDKREYDFGIISDPTTCETNSAPVATPTRETAITYASFSTTPVGGTILDRPSIVQVKGGGTLAAETDYSYDGYGTNGIASVSATGHDDTKFPASYTNRGNATTKTVKCLQSGCPTAVTTYGYDQTGQAISVTDPCGNGSCSDMTVGTNHTTTYSYNNAFTVLSGGVNVPYTASGNTDAYVTNIVDPLGHTRKFTYDFNSGELTQSQDQNDINAKRTGTTYTYNDPFARPTLVGYPDGGQTEYAYNDSGPSPTITTCELISGTAGAACSPTSLAAGWKTTVATMDGLGRPVATDLASDPDSPTFTATAYDGFGRVYKQSNPYRSSSSSPTNGTTQYTYDGLGRTIQVSRPDGSIVFNSYNGNETITTDEIGRSRAGYTDALGRLTRVDEPQSTELPTQATAIISISGSGIKSSTIPATPGTGQFWISGTQKEVYACPAACFWTWDQGTAFVSVNGGTPYSYPYSGQGATATGLEQFLASIVSGSQLVSASYNSSNSTVTVTARTGGANTNYPLTAWVKDYWSPTQVAHQCLRLTPPD